MFVINWLIPLSEAHLRTILGEWVAHYNRGRPRMCLGPGIPDPPHASAAYQQSNHRLNIAHVRVRPVLGGLHHEYALSH